MAPAVWNQAYFDHFDIYGKDESGRRDQFFCEMLDGNHFIFCNFCSQSPPLPKVFAKSKEGCTFPCRKKKNPGGIRGRLCCMRK